MQNVFNIHTKKSNELAYTMPKPPIVKPFHLIIGIISDLDKQVIPLLHDISLLKQQQFIKKLDVIILENSNGADRSKINLHLNQISNNSIIISKKQQLKDSEDGVFGLSFIRDNSKLPISKSYFPQFQIC